MILRIKRSQDRRSGLPGLKLRVCQRAEGEGKSYRSLETTLAAFCDAARHVFICHQDAFGCDFYLELGHWGDAPLAEPLPYGALRDPNRISDVLLRPEVLDGLNRFHAPNSSKLLSESQKHGFRKIEDDNRQASITFDITGGVGMEKTISLVSLTGDTLGDRLKKARKFRKMSQVTLGKMMGISQSAVGQCERGETKELTPSNLLRAAAALDINPIWLIDGKGSMLDRRPSTADLAAKIEQLDESQRAAVLAVVESFLAG